MVFSYSYMFHGVLLCIPYLLFVFLLIWILYFNWHFSICENPTIQNTFTRSNGTLVKMINHLLLLRCMKVTGLHFLHIVMSMHVFNHKCIFCFTKVIYCICIRQSNDWKNWIDILLKAGFYKLASNLANIIIDRSTLCI